MRRLAALALSSLVCLTAHALPAKPMDDAELAEVSGGDGVDFALHLELNQIAPGAMQDSRLTIGQTVEGRTTYTVIKNISGVIDMVGLNLSANVAPDGTNYVALSLPFYVKYTNVGFESLSVQSDPRAPVTDSMGRFTLNGTTSMQGQLRMWAH